MQYYFKRQKTRSASKQAVTIFLKKRKKETDIKWWLVSMKSFLRLSITRLS